MGKTGTAMRRCEVTAAMRARLGEVREAFGFDASRIDVEDGRISVRCSQCEALVISGHPTHERGCPNTMQACRGCDARIPASTWMRYCADCEA